MKVEPTYHVEVTMQELETIERALMIYQEQLYKRDYLPETIKNEQKHIANICKKLSKA